MISITAENNPPGDDTPSLRVTGLTKVFVETPALLDVDLTVMPGQVHALLGENGSGKSTLIKVLSGYHRPEAGKVLIAGGRLQFGSFESAYRLGCRVVHQDLGLVESSSILDNFALSGGFPTRLGTIRRRLARRQADEALSRLNLHLDVRLAGRQLPAGNQDGRRGGPCPPGRHGDASTSTDPG